MNIGVLLKRAPDVRVPVEREAGSGRVRLERQVAELDPAAAAALATALELHGGDRAGQVTVLTLGPDTEDHTLREALAAGASRAVRIWEEPPEGWETGLSQARTHGKAVVLAAACRVLAFDVLLAGTRSADSSGGQLAALLAAELGLTFVGQVMSTQWAPEERVPAEWATTAQGATLQVVRALAHGYQEVLEARPPLVLAVEPRELEPLFPEVPQLLAAQRAAIEVWDLAEIGVPAAAVRQADRAILSGSLRFPKPRRHVTPAPDSSLPAFDRIQKLVQGTVSRREGSVHVGEAETAAGKLFERLRREGWLDHLRPGAEPKT